MSIKNLLYADKVMTPKDRKNIRISSVCGSAATLMFALVLLVRVMSDPPMLLLLALFATTGGGLLAVAFILLTAMTLRKRSMGIYICWATVQAAVTLMIIVILQ